LLLPQRGRSTRKGDRIAPLLNRFAALFSPSGNAAGLLTLKVSRSRCAGGPKRRNSLAAISEIRVGMGVFSADGSRIGTVYNVDEDRLTLLGDPDSAYADGHYRVANVLIAGLDEGRILLSKDAEAALILAEAHAEPTSNEAKMHPYSAPSGTQGAAIGGDSSSLPVRRGATSGTSASRHEWSGSSSVIAAGAVLLGIVAVVAIPFVFGGRKRTEIRPQRAGEAATTRYGMEDGDNTDIPATGGPDSWDDESTNK
jgi:hypothetical protein